ncbi:hypothetical protein K7432_002866 [Basidiobolus ranarum]|uniref:CSC1/OSCA1-like N-terminal transmembrane domain-containing protein n=1 Tax=Basidiobolus ranarum TaxID=34480 RepID=A0ABR2X122_9FUNG
MKEPNATPLITQLTLATPIFAFCLLFFCLLRNKWKGFYSPKTNWKSLQGSLPTLPPTIFTWIPALYRIEENEIMSSAGLDAVMCLRFWRMGLIAFCFCMLWSCLVLIPISFIAGGGFDEIHKNPFSINSIEDRSNFFIVHTAFT